jgi:hypothetical protein
MARDPAIDIRNDLLRAVVGIKLEGGITASQIRALVDKFAGEARSCDATTEVVSFLWVEDIPHEQRAAFMQAIAALPSADGSSIAA